MATDNEKTLKRLKVTIKVTEITETPARGFMPGIRSWRVSLSRELKDQEKPTRFTMTMLSAKEPTIVDIMATLLEDAQAGDMNLWEFAQTFGFAKVDKVLTERTYKTAKRASGRIRRFFGDVWTKFSSAA
jgi:hypothetical protein